MKSLTETKSIYKDKKEHFIEIKNYFCWLSNVNCVYTGDCVALKKDIENMILNREKQIDRVTAKGDCKQITNVQEYFTGYINEGTFYVSEQTGYYG